MATIFRVSLDTGFFGTERPFVIVVINVIILVDSVESAVVHSAQPERSQSDVTKPATITITLELTEVLDATITAPEGGSTIDQDLLQRLATGLRALVLTDETTVRNAARIYQLANNDRSPDVSTSEITRILQEAELERLMSATHDPSDPLH